MLSQNVSKYFMLSHYLPSQSRRSCSGTQKILRTTHKRNENKHLSSSRAAQHFLQFAERLVIKNCVSRYTSQSNRSLFHSSMQRFAITFCKKRFSRKRFPHNFTFDFSNQLESFSHVLEFSRRFTKHTTNIIIFPQLLVSFVDSASVSLRLGIGVLGFSLTHESLQRKKIGNSFR